MSSAGRPLNHISLRSRAFEFLILDAPTPNVILAFKPYVTYCVWVSSINNQGTWSIRGYLQLFVAKTKRTMKKRFCKVAVWHPCDYQNIKIIEKYSLARCYVGDQRDLFGEPFHVNPSPDYPLNLPPLPSNYNEEEYCYDDLIEAYIEELSNNQYEIYYADEQRLLCDESSRFLVPPSYFYIR